MFKAVEWVISNEEGYHIIYENPPIYFEFDFQITQMLGITMESYFVLLLSFCTDEFKKARINFLFKNKKEAQLACDYLNERFGVILNV